MIRVKVKLKAVLTIGTNNYPLGYELEMTDEMAEECIRLGLVEPLEKAEEKPKKEGKKR